MVKRFCQMVFVCGLVGVSQARETENLTARLQQAIMDASIQEMSALLINPQSREKSFSSLWFSHYRTVDAWTAGAPARFVDYNTLARQAYAATGRGNLHPALKTSARKAWLELYDFSAHLTAKAPPGHLHALWSQHETLLRSFPERLFLIQKISPPHDKESHCAEVVEKFLTRPDPPGQDKDTGFFEAARVTLACLGP